MLYRTKAFCDNLYGLEQTPLFWLRKDGEKWRKQGKKLVNFNQKELIFLMLRIAYFLVWWYNRGIKRCPVSAVRLAGRSKMS